MLGVIISPRRSVGGPTASVFVTTQMAAVERDERSSVNVNQLAVGYCI